MYDMNEKFYNKEKPIEIEESYSAIFEKNRDGYLIWKGDGQILTANTAYCEMLGYSLEEIKQQNWIEFTHGKWIENEISDQGTKCVKRGYSDLYEKEYIRKDGTVFPVEIQSYTFKKNKDFDSCIGYAFVRDITRRKQMEKKIFEKNEQLRILNDQLLASEKQQKKDVEEIVVISEDLKKSNEELQEFAYIASHDLQEPLRVISSYCQLLKEKEYDRVDEEGKKYFDYVIDSSIRMKTLIKELLDYSGVGRRDKPFEKINLKNLLQEVLHDFEFRIKETKAQIIIENNLPEIFGVSFRIKQLLHNIISNSLKFIGKKHPIIRIGCCEDLNNSNSWFFYIKDNGIGIEPKYYNRVFGIFRRLYSREEYPGTGIGLALCKRIVETHHGEIWVESQTGDGTSIYFTISKSWNVVNN